MSEVRFEATAGRIYWGHLRDCVERARFDGLKIDMWEGRGILSKDFAFRGEPKAIERVRALFAYWERLDREEAQRRSKRA